MIDTMEQMDAIEKMMRKGVEDRVFPGAVLLVSLHSKILFHQSFGRSDIYSNEMMTKKTVFDLASLTKPLATVMAVLKLIQDGLLCIDQTLGSVFNSRVNSSAFDLPLGLNNAHDAISTCPEDKADITVEELLRHTSGLPSHKDYYKQIRRHPHVPGRNYLRKLLIKEPLVYKPGEKEVYSDLGYMLLSWIVEIVSNQRIDNFVKKHVYSFLGIEDLFFIDLKDFEFLTGETGISMYNGMPSESLLKSETWKLGISTKNFAATENCPWRGKIIKAEVHDDNAWAAGGIEGHAGLFGTASAVFVLLDELMKALKGEKTRVISGTLLKQFIMKDGSNDMVAGFDTPSRPVSSSGKYFSDSSIGHLGFTGTSFWMDPEKSLIVILLTNRVHPSRKNEKIKWFRPLIHDLVMEHLYGV